MYERLSPGSCAVACLAILLGGCLPIQGTHWLPLVLARLMISATVTVYPSAWVGQLLEQHSVGSVGAVATWACLLLSSLQLRLQLSTLAHQSLLLCIAAGFEDYVVMRLFTSSWRVCSIVNASLTICLPFLVGPSILVVQAVVTSAVSILMTYLLPAKPTLSEAQAQEELCNLSGLTGKGVEVPPEPCASKSLSDSSSLDSGSGMSSLTPAPCPQLPSSLDVSQVPSVPNTSAPFISWARLLGLASPQALEEPQPYRSITGERIQVSIKLNTSSGLPDLPEHLAALLAERVMSSCTHQAGAPDMHLFSVAARAGCILLHLDIAQTCGQGLSSDTAECLVTSLLPTLTPLFKLQDIESSQTHELIQCQVGDQIWQAAWEPTTCLWHTHQNTQLPLELALTPAAGQPRAQLIHVRPVAAMWLETYTEPMGSKAAGSAGSAGARATTCDTHSSTCRVYQLSVHVLMSGVARDELVTGWQPPVAGQHQGPRGTTRSAASLQLLAACEGHYLITHVMEVFYKGQPCWEVQIQVPELVMPRHHPGAAPAGVLPVTLQLARGDVVLDSAPLLLGLEPREAVGGGTGGGKQSVWWWGCDGNVIQAALAELQQWNDTAWQLAARAAASRGDEHLVDACGSREFVADLILWMSETREVAVMCNFCQGCAHDTNGLHGTRLGRPSLPLSTLHVLAADLAEHAQSVGFHHVAAMIRQQSARVLKTAARQLPNHHSNCPTARNSNRSPISQRLLHSLRGYPCSQCEARYMAQLSGHLVTMQPIASAGVLGAVAMMVSRSVAGNGVAVMWGLLHAAALLCTALCKPGQVDPAKYLNAISYLMRVISELLVCLGLQPVMPAALQLYKSNFMVMWMPFMILLSLGEQMQLASVMPAARILMLTCVQAVVLTGCAVRCGSKASLWWLLLLGHIGTVVMPRVLLDAHVRYASLTALRSQARKFISIQPGRGW